MSFEASGWVWWVQRLNQEEAAVVTSQNGYAANDRSAISRFTVPGTNVVLALRRGPTATVLLHVAEQFHRRVESIENARGHLDDWGYAERPIRGSTTELSNHASGTAMDLNATRHVLGAAPRASFSAGQIDAIHRILAEVGGVVRWGGDYSGRKDGMHFEIVAAPGPVSTWAARLTRVIAPVKSHPEEDMPLSDQDVEKVGDYVVKKLLNTTLGRGKRTVGMVLQDEDTRNNEEK